MTTQNERSLPSCVRMQAVQDPVIPIVGEMVRDNPGTISLGQGVVYYAPPESVYDSFDEFRADPQNHKYKLVQGIPQLLTSIADKLARDNDIEVDPLQRVVVTSGGNMGFMNAVLAITDSGDEIILPGPYYFNHEMAITIASCRPRIVPTDEMFQLRIDAIREAINDKTRAVVTTSPNNPTGAVYPEEALREVNALCRERGIHHISDEAYEYFSYDGAEVFSPGSIPGAGAHTISLYSLSKAYGFAGWRIGYMVIPETLLDPIKKIQDTILICPQVICQFAAVKAMEAGRAYCLEKRREIEFIREILLSRLSQLGPHVTVGPAQGAFYVLLDIATDRHPLDVVRNLVEQYHVAVIPGNAFGIEDTCTLRVAYGALQRDTAEEGIGRLAAGLQALA